MNEIRIVNQIQEYDEMIGAETLHPLVNVVDFSRLPPMRHISVRRLFGYYAIYLKGPKYTELHYGRNTYNYNEGALVFFAPGQVAGVEDDGKLYKMSHRVLMFHPDLLQGSYLQSMMKNYSYFSYDTNEALFPSEDERKIFISYLNMIESELHKNDKHSILIVIDYIKLILDYCSRFYDRQFDSRRVENKDILVRFEKLMTDYYSSELSKKNGLLTVQYCADKLCLSTNYFSDLIRRETGISALKHIHKKTLEISKELLLDTSSSINGISEKIGFQYPQHFSKWFKSLDGCTPNEYRKKK